MNSNARIDELDYLRGFALLGILLVNLPLLLAVPLPAAESADAVYWNFLYLFVEGRFFTIFSFLFGIGFYLFISRANARGENGTLLFLRRIAAMFLFGLVHSMYHPGEALTIYAVCGLLIFPCYKLRKEVNLIISIVFIIGFSLLGIKMFLPLPLILLGFTIGQYQLFENLAAKRKSIRLFTIGMFGLSFLTLLYQLKKIPVLPEDNIWNLEMFEFYHTVIMIGPIVSAFYVGGMILLLQNPVMQKILSPLKYYGRMALTNYLSQTAFIFLLGREFELAYLQTLYVCLNICFIQIVFSRIWLHFFHFGPFEWLWRCFTYLKVSPFLKRT
ncbi:DUF418 domain-containing protein [Bacillus sp. B15-48]|uniref:DUF418 domain-containing protein n=1 Tax=Bacillus sp. B15-48 TaxID=1548601 RepID=UPI00193F7AF3|nr:DUF418 domain-containing protein [Bacillus sp. B15-48]MBM4760794.1 DUF418 domain-containing protein [Bacillus sp. B15-48]